MDTTVNVHYKLWCLWSCVMTWSPASLCFAQTITAPPPAYSIAARRSGVPSNVLFAVALQESGMTLRGKRLPWPWTLNLAGNAQYFATHADACRALRAGLMRLPAFRIDVGLTQINLGHQRRFYQDPCEVLSPNKNLTIAATILREQYRVDEDWLMAAGRYHRPAGGRPAARYRRSVARHLNDLALTEGGRP
ncbi:lytic transglycosylase [Pseudomonas jessenii]|nr:lytic transglycosylase [Pseudomonas jessenii]